MPSRKFSFDLHGCRDWLDKLCRECDRLEASDDRTEISDHAINAALTGWHLHEWVWAEVKEIERANPPNDDNLEADTLEQLRLQLTHQKKQLANLRIEIAKEINCSPAKVGKTEFGQFMANRHQSINVCRVIATGSKHLDVDDDRNIVAYVSAHPTLVASSQSRSRPDFSSEIFKGAAKI